MGHGVLVLARGRWAGSRCTRSCCALARESCGGGRAHGRGTRDLDSASSDNRGYVLKRRLSPLSDDIYPADPWRLVETRFSERYYPRAETIFAVANGFIGIRGTLEEGRPALAPGTFVSGFHETWRILHAEEAFGLARTGQTIANVPDATVVKLYVDDEPRTVLATARRWRPCDAVVARKSFRRDGG